MKLKFWKKEIDPKVAEEARIKMVNEAGDAMAKSIAAMFMDVSRTMTDEIRNGFKEVRKEWNRETVNEKNGTVYGFYFIRKVYSVIGTNAMLVMAVADSDSGAINKAKGIMTRNGFNPNEWDINLSNRLEIITKRETPTAMPPPVKSKSVDTYISNLMYAKDRFADTPHEKAVITKIINKINQNHARNNTTG